MDHFIQLNQQQFATDEFGYLKNLADWSPELAEEIAKAENITLTPEHWEIVFFVREFYQEYKTSPAIRMLVKSLAQKFGEEKGNSRYLQHLFPDGPAKQATKIAGLPKPAKCL
ncbi:sulfur transfer protein TusE [[Actinobacillus] muris]|uniref:Sulfurtransferase n=1 Tax=Muribacter muris TaxID=67855 RepID=A0A0J5S5M1_9PAST|nr:TusE/DsrC/DsvC family sulfur relay protein [Muribacter muris]KMK52142.1 sulfur transfer protein TusE [[Actinobacillus] muris] [Muribacter muris]